MKLLVLGGTRFLSRAVAVQAAARGHEVIVAARGESGEPPPGARFVYLDRQNPSEGLAKLKTETFDAVVDVSRIPSEVAAVLDALADKAGHWSFVSTISTYSDDVTTGQTPETGPVHDPTPSGSSDGDEELYGPSKVACENLVRDRLGDRHLIARPGLIIGPGDPSYRFGYWPDRFADGGEVLAPGDPDRLVQWIDVRDHAEWLIDAAETHLTGTFDFVCPPVTMAEFLDEVREAMDGRAELTWVPDDFLQRHDVAYWAGENSIGLWLPTATHAGMCAHDVTASLAAGLRIRPVAESARDWYESERGKPRNPEKRLSRDREAEVLAAWHARGNW
ncbi:MAG: NAD-dependent epimerase/dehydratase family protein [Stackebrandtia sp.]